MNLLFAIRDIQRRTGKDLGATFLSGTVVVNALTELYVMFKYLRPRELKRQQVSCFDAWAAIFTKKAADLRAERNGYDKAQRAFRTYIKVPELAMFLAGDYRLSYSRYDKPRCAGQKRAFPFPCTHYPTGGNDRAARRLCAQRTMGRFGVGYSAAGQSRQAKMLVATNVARKMSLDMRLLGDKFTDDPNNKASICARTIYDYYVSSNANRGTQFVFSDLATYKPNEWNIYSDIKDKLVGNGDSCR